MKQRLKNQIVIIGAGPAGVITSLILAKNQIRTILLDKEEFPRHKVCGDIITGNTLRIMNELDPSWLKKMNEDRLAVPIKGSTVYAPNYHNFDVDFMSLEKGTTQPSCYAIRRIDFDNFLLQRARENAYITIIENCNIDKVERLKTGGLQVKTKSEDLIIDTECLVFCTGSNSSLINDVYPVKKRDRDVAVGVRAYFEGVKPESKPGYGDLFIPKKFLPGGLYLTPLPDGTVNINVVMRSDVVKKKKINLNKLMMEELKENPVLNKRFENAKLIGKPQGNSLFLGTRRRKLSGDNFLFVGDAAGLIDFISANGIPQAMLSAKIAAEEISRCVLANDFSASALAPYDRRIYKRLESYLKISKLASPFMASPFFLKVVTAAMNYVARKFNKNQEISSLIYEQNVVRKLINPVYYYRLLFGIKNKESLKN